MPDGHLDINQKNENWINIGFLRKLVALIFLLGVVVPDQTHGVKNLRTRGQAHLCFAM